MIMNFKHIIALIMSVLFATAAFSGCSSSDKPFEPDREITVITREAGSGTRDAFVEITNVLEKGENTKTDRTRVDAVTVNSTEAVITNVKGNNSAIGYISLGSLNETVKALKVEDVAPTAENIKNGTYQISRSFNIAYKGELSDLEKDFVDFILSLDGQNVVAKQGYVTVTEDAKFSGTKPQGKITVAGSSSVAPVMEKLIEAYKEINTNADVELQVSDSSTGLQAVLNDTCDIGMASRELKDTEKELTSITIAKDGIVLIANTKNTADSLTMEQVKKIYTNKAITWSDILNET